MYLSQGHAATVMAAPARGLVLEPAKATAMSALSLLLNLLWIAFGGL